MTCLCGQPGTPRPYLTDAPVLCDVCIGPWTSGYRAHARLVRETLEEIERKAAA